LDHDQKIRYAEKVFNDVGMEITLGASYPARQSPLAVRIMAILLQDRLISRLSFRDVNQICTNAAITRFNYNNGSHAICLISLLLILKTVNHSLYQRAMNLEYITEEIFALFDISLNDLSSLKDNEYFYQAMKDFIAYFAKTPADFLDKEVLKSFDYQYLSQERDREGVRKISFKEKVLPPLKSFKLSNTEATRLGGHPK